MRQVSATGDAQLRALYEEVRRHPVPPDEETAAVPDSPGARPSPVQVPLRVRTPHGELSMFSTMATFGAPADVTLSELAIELFYPLDDFTTKALRGLAGMPGGMPGHVRTGS
ncbi:hypothetical protein [Streptomyces piniterrae]|uniref:MmyB family transcriptional regulator n=1 Tax=Streptomyces piniterrae TaxID=2571125 RepID=UPI002482E08D|nr:hypothetical protein [Streptomyces piniterrae]